MILKCLFQNWILYTIQVHSMGSLCIKKVYEPNKQVKAYSKEKIFLRLKFGKPIKTIQPAKCLSSGGLTG